MTSKIEVYRSRPTVFYQMCYTRVVFFPLRLQDWSNELVRIAQTYASLCIFDHNSARTDQQVDLNFAYVGENIAITSSSRSNYTALIETWYNEHRVYNYSANNCSGVCGHYLQVITLLHATVTNYS